MIIPAIARYQSFDNKSKGLKKPGIDLMSKQAPVDVYQPSDDLPKTDTRKDLLKTVKKRITDGYYNSKEVLEDLSDSFAKVLNRAL